jgi:hypothetical protein
MKFILLVLVLTLVACDVPSFNNNPGKCVYAQRDTTKCAN